MADIAASPAPAISDADARRGFFFALSAYLTWGLLPFYLKAVAHIPAAEVVAQRTLWSLPVAGAVLLWLGRTGDIGKVLRSPRKLAMACLTATILSINWGIYVWAIATGRTMEGALGYYINPLWSVFLASVVLGEKLDRPKLAAIGLAALAVAVLGWEAGGLPWISLSLAFTWGFYALFKKTLPIGPNQGFFVEVLLLSVPALAYLVWLESSGQGHFVGVDWSDMGLLMLSGPATAVPLILYGNGAKLLKLSTIGVMQYIAPTIVFLIAVFVFREPFSVGRAAAFALIWAALAVFTWSILRERGAERT
ncbi:MAG TPA: EamA family transporter RarD [Mesorhizobium sp.]|jgi:chloramphenicol-sensitive protein RarD|nr:EamA family transporter RarD [Mesorhizobium sp.]